MRIKSPRRAGAVAFAGIGITALLLTGCTGGNGGSGGGDSSEPLQMWTRDVTASQSQPLVDEWNKTHKQQVELTVVPAANYLQKVGVAAGAKELPCLMASDVVYAPNFIDKNLLLDITDKVDGLKFKDALAPGHIDVSTKDGKIYAVPHTLAVSAIFQNNVLLQQAGIDPSVPVTTLGQLKENALKVAALGPDYTGFFFSADSAGTVSFTLFPSIWADGGEALSKDGTKSLLDSPESVAVFKAYNDMYTSGAAPSTTPSQQGTGRNDAFATGKVGYVLASNSVLQAVPESDTVKIGVQEIPGVKADAATYLGGDVLGISASCSNPDAAWDFLAWSLSEDAQVGIYGPLNQLMVRTDLSDNKYTKANPNLQKLNAIVKDGRTPFALRYAETFNDPQGPALKVFRDAFFGTDAEAALKAGNDSITASLKQ
jgi:multiple sugar transport system substrate-binding protein